MYRKFDDEISAMKLKTGAEIQWIFGYKVYETLGRFEVAIQDGGKGTLKVIESVQETSAHAIYSSVVFAASALTILAF